MPVCSAAVSTSPIFQVVGVEEDGSSTHFSESGLSVSLGREHHTGPITLKQLDPFHPISASQHASSN